MSGVAIVYKWELLKLRAQKRTYLGLGAAMLVPIIFVAVKPDLAVHRHRDH